jgi:hypothetical protein
MEREYTVGRIQRQILKRIGEAIRNELAIDPIPNDLFRLVTELDVGMATVEARYHQRLSFRSLPNRT